MSASANRRLHIAWEWRSIRNRGEKAAHKPDAERRAERDIHDDQAQPGVQEPNRSKNLEERREQQNARKDVDNQHQIVERCRRKLPDGVYPLARARRDRFALPMRCRSVPRSSRWGKATRHCFGSAVYSRTSRSTPSWSSSTRQARSRIAARLSRYRPVFRLAREASYARRSAIMQPRSAPTQPAGLPCIATMPAGAPAAKLIQAKAHGA